MMEGGREGGRGEGGREGGREKRGEEKRYAETCEILAIFIPPVHLAF